MTRSRMTAGVGLALVALLAVSGCGGEKVGGGKGAAKGDCGDFNLAINPWVGYEANAAVIAEVAESKLGCNVTKKDLRHHRLEEPQQVRRLVQDLRVGKQGPAPRR